MSDRLKIRLYKYGGSALFVVLMAALHISLNHGFAEFSTADKLRVICDALTIPGTVLVLVGLLIWVTNQGTLYGLGYIAGNGLKALIPGKGLERTERYADYVSRKKEKKITGYGFLYISGGVTLALAMVFLALFYIV